MEDVHSWLFPCPNSIYRPTLQAQVGPISFGLIHQEPKQGSVYVSMPDDQNSAAFFLNKNSAKCDLDAFGEVDEAFASWNAIETAVLFARFPQSLGFRIAGISEPALEYPHMQLVEFGFALNR